MARGIGGWKVNAVLTEATVCTRERREGIKANKRKSGTLKQRELGVPGICDK